MDKTYEEMLADLINKVIQNSISVDKGTISSLIHDTIEIEVGSEQGYEKKYRKLYEILFQSLKYNMNKIFAEIQLWNENNKEDK